MDEISREKLGDMVVGLHIRWLRDEVNEKETILVERLHIDERLCGWETSWLRPPRGKYPHYLIITIP